METLSRECFEMKIPLQLEQNLTKLLENIKG